MKTLIAKIINGCANNNKDIALDFVRIYLGLELLFRGLIFMTNPEIFAEYTQNIDGFVIPMVMIHYLTLAHLVGGLFLLVLFSLF